MTREIDRCTDKRDVHDKYMTLITSTWDRDIHLSSTCFLLVHLIYLSYHVLVMYISLVSTSIYLSYLYLFLVNSRYLVFIKDRYLVFMFFLLSVLSIQVSVLSIQDRWTHVRKIKNVILTILSIHFTCRYSYMSKNMIMARALVLLHVSSS